MDEIKRMLFQQQRFQILALFTSGAQRNVTPEYAYAWAEGVYPLFNEAADWHLAYEAQFHVTKDEVGELSKFLDDLWLKKQPITFYDLESHYGVHGSSSQTGSWDRLKLIHACRYMHLKRLFDPGFWAALLTNGKCPMEAHSIADPFDSKDVYFV